MGKLLRFDDAHYIHFITTRTRHGISYFKKERNCLILLKVIQELRQGLHFKLLGYVIMPDHLYCLIESDIKGDYSISYIMMRIKGYSARIINLAEAETSAKREVDHQWSAEAEQGVDHNCLGEGSKAETSAKREVDHQWSAEAEQGVDHNCLGEGSASPYHNIWQKSFYDISIFSEKFLEQKLTYIHNNPIRAGLVQDLADYPWSSYQNYYMDNNSFIEIDY